MTSGAVSIALSRLTRRAVLRAAILTVASIALLACSASGNVAKPTSDATSASQPKTETVTMNDQARYVPATLTIAKGTTVEWQNTSAFPHTVTFHPGKTLRKTDAQLPAGVEPFDSDILDPGKSFKVTFTVPGEYTYFCIPHESVGMVAKLTVTE
jgi:plastocyanin